MLPNVFGTIGWMNKTLPGGGALEMQPSGWSLCLASLKPRALQSAPYKPSAVAWNCKPSIWEVVTGES